MRGTLVAFAVIAVSASATANLITDPGFEAVGGILGSGSSFRPFPLSDAGWTATQTDGEVFQSTSGRPAKGGRYYADLLQNPGGNPGGFWDRTSFGFGNFDRITTFVNVSPNTSYTLGFWHAGGDRFGYVAHQTLVQVQSMQTGYAVQDLSATPGLYNWQSRSFVVTTDSATTRLAISFSPLGQGAASALIDDCSMVVVPEPATLAALGAGLAMVARRRRSR